MKRFLGTVGAVAALGATPALAAEFTTFDADADRFISRDEFQQQPVEAWFNAYDLNEDALLDSGEIADLTYAAMDLDGDGKVTVEEWNTWVERRVRAGVNPSAAKWDDDGDGVISHAEFKEQTGELQAGGESAPYAWLGGDPGKDDVYDLDEFRVEVFEQLDVDDDERLSEEEFRAAGAFEN